jgi:16S rRNA (guanine(966)-N(2))-methyltransferase RsmD
MIRIITGSAKNKRLKTPKIPDFHSVQEVAKGAVFSIIGDEKVQGAQCLDLYAGSGNLGLEALSRGAAWCDFVDEHKEAKKVITENINDCRFGHKAEFHFKDAVKYVSNTEKVYDIIFVDPFYKDTAHVFLMENLEEILNPQGMIVFFHGENLDIKKTIAKTKLHVTDERKFGQSIFTIINHNASVNSEKGE